MVVRPTGSYQIEVPDNIVSQIDERVTSFWINNEPLLLQLSSYSYDSSEGSPASAETRLRDRIRKNAGEWVRLDRKIARDSAVDQAFAKYIDGSTVWLHGYFVWPHLTVYATISGPENTIQEGENWAYKALASLSPVLH